MYVDAPLVYCLLAEILYAEENLGLAALMVQVLNMILFTATELYQLRLQLRELATAVRRKGGWWGEVGGSLGHIYPAVIVLSKFGRNQRHFFIIFSGYSPGFFFRGPKKCVEKSNPSESKRKEKLNGTCFSCIAHVSREL